MTSSTAQKILDVAQDLVRNRGYSAFSYADIAAQIGIRKASIHYHFASKEELALALVQRYRTTFLQALQAIEQTIADPQAQLQEFCALYRGGLIHQQMCLCGMLSAELFVLPPSVQSEVRDFFGEMTAWLQALLERGMASDRFQIRVSAADEAALLLATVQGAQLLARAAADSEAEFDRLMHRLFLALCPGG